MRLVIQRVNSASVTINGAVYSSIQTGLMVLIGIEHADTEADAVWLAGKLAGLRIFDDEIGVMNRSVTDIEGEVLVVSQFTLHALTKKGNRPSYMHAAGHEKAVPLYEYFCQLVSTKLGRQVKTGVFAADMQVALVNNGPVTIWMDSKNKE